MPLNTRSKCKENYNVKYPHTCPKTEAEKREIEKQKWEKASGLGKVFLYHPDTPYLVRMVSYFWLYISAGGLLITVVTIVFLIKEVVLGNNIELEVYQIYSIVMGVGGLSLAYGLTHLKRWSLFLYAAIIIFMSIMAGGIFIILSLGFIPLIMERKKFGVGSR